MQQAKESADSWITPKEVAATFGVTVSTVGDWRRRGLLPAVRFSRRVVRFRVSDVRAAVERMAAQGGAK